MIDALAPPPQTFSFVFGRLCSFVPVLIDRGRYGTVLDSLLGKS